MKALVFIIALVILSLTAVSCAQPVAPTATAYPTYTPAPTHTPYPTLAALPTYTPYPTLSPLPTHTPYPTPTALPTYTPYPTLEQLPTHTPYPTPTALPTYTPYPTATPAPTYTPIPTPVLIPTPTRSPSSANYRTYTSYRHSFGVSVPNDWDIDYDGESIYSFIPSSRDVVVALQIWTQEPVFPLSTYVVLLVARLEDFEVLESYAIGSNRWYLRGRDTNSSCDLESRFHFFRAEKVYSVYESGCPLAFTKWKEPLERFRATLRFW